MEQLKEKTQLKLFAKVALDRSIPILLDYSFENDLDIQVGMRVEVPFRNTTEKGVIVSIAKTSSFDKVQPIIKIIDAHLQIPKDLIDLAHWMENYYLTPLSKIFQLIVPPYVKKAVQSKQQVYVERAKPKNVLIDVCSQLRQAHKKRAHVLDIMLKTKGSILLETLSKQAQVSTSVIDALVNAKWLKKTKVSSFSTGLNNLTFVHEKKFTLNAEQLNVIETIKPDLINQVFQVHLLHGITGSGKTEVYIEAIEQTLNLGKSAILLVPEVALTTQIYERIQKRFGSKVVWLHHRLSMGQRHTFWQQLYSNEAKIVVGPRSALFSPMPNLGLIIIDEEHDNSYKQDHEPTYQARDVAIMRAKLRGCPILLGSATPSMESFYHANSGKYKLSTLKKRARDGMLPTTHIVNMKEEADPLFSRLFSTKLKDTLEKSQQAMILLNRRGYRSFQICQNCKEVTKCPSCDKALTYHKNDQMLLCHLCGYFLTPPPKNCLSCDQNTTQFRGFGTEFIQNALQAKFPGIQTLRLDRDTTARKGEMEKILDQFKAKKASVLIGTQMIAKGFDISSVTLALILNCDLSLNLPDFRSSENTFSLMTQMAGRSGRDEKGEVVFQTLNPKNPTIQLAAKQDYNHFYDQEIQFRKELDFPPFCRLIRILIKAKEEKKAKEISHLLFEELKQSCTKGDSMYPPIQAGHAKISNLWRYQILLKTKNIQAMTNKLRQSKVFNQNIRSIMIDIDPINTFF